MVDGGYADCFHNIPLQWQWFAQTTYKSFNGLPHKTLGWPWQVSLLSWRMIRYCSGSLWVSSDAQHNPQIRVHSRFCTRLSQSRVFCMGVDRIAWTCNRNPEHTPPVWRTKPRHVPLQSVSLEPSWAFVFTDGLPPLITRTATIELFG